MNLKGFLLIILAFSFMGCSTTTKKDSDAVNPLSGKNDNIYADGVMEGHKPPKEIKLSSLLYDLGVDPEPEKFAKKHGIFFRKVS